MSIRLALFLTLIVSLPTLANAQQPPSGPAAQPPPLAQQVDPAVRRTMAAVRMDAGESITLDGRLDEGIWMRAVPRTSSSRIPSKASLPQSRRKSELFTVNNVQYDTQTAVVGWQSRFRWIVQPGNDLYFVYIHNWLDDPLSLSSRFHTLDRRATSKVSYTHRF